MLPIYKQKRQIENSKPLFISEEYYTHDEKSVTTVSKQNKNVNNIDLLSKSAKIDHS